MQPTSTPSATTSNLKGATGGPGGGGGAGGGGAVSNNNTSIDNTNQNNNPTLVHRKVAILGWKNVGKSSLVNAFITGTFCPTDPNTIETTYTKTIRFRKVHFHTDIVDTAGSQGVSSTDDDYGASTTSRLSRNASLGVHGYVLVFSLVSRQSFEQVQRVNASLLKTLGNTPDTLAVPRVLVGTMKDLADSYNSSTSSQTSQSAPYRQVSFIEAQTLAMSWKGGQGIPYIECSSKTGEGVADVFHTLLKEIEKDDGLLLSNEYTGYYPGMMFSTLPSSCVVL